MPAPTQDEINTAVEAWRDASLGIGAIAANTPAYNQIFDSIAGLEADIFNSIDDESESAATGTLTFTAGEIADDKVEIGGVWYVFAASLSGSADGSSGTPWKVALGEDDEGSLANLRKAINASGTGDTDYSLDLVEHPTVTATASNATTLTVAAKIVGEDGNEITVSVTPVNGDDGLAWGNETLTGGTGDDVDAAAAVIDTWRDTLRAWPINTDADAEAQLDAAIPDLKTAIAVLYT